MAMSMAMRIGRRLLSKNSTANFERAMRSPLPISLRRLDEVKEWQWRWQDEGLPFYAHGNQLLCLSIA